MPNLDFMTLYVVIFLTSLTVAIVWGAFTLRYKQQIAPRYWLAACLLSLVGGIVLAIQGNAGSLAPAVIGNSIIVYSFMQFWVGLRRFSERGGGQAHAVAVTAVALCLMVLFHDNDRARSMVYAGGQASVMLLCSVTLLRMRPLGIGGAVAGGGFLIALFGQLAVIGGNAGVMTGALPYDRFYTLASYALMCTIFTASIWNLGFAVMLIEKLQDELARLSETDDLTGLGNRRAFTRRLAEVHRHASTAGEPYAVMMADMNGFKQLNDTHGHAAGDRALVEVARIMKSCARRSDVVTRIGGDEFCLILPATGERDAQRVLQTIRQRIDAYRFRVGDGELALAAAIGVAEWAPQSELGAAAVVAAADRKLYEQKADPAKAPVVSKQQHLRAVSVAEADH